MHISILKRQISVNYKEEVEDLVRDALKPAAGRIRLAYIEGSITKGANRSRSDLDLLVVGGIAFGETMDLLRLAEQRIGREISPRLFSEKEFGLRRRKHDRFLISLGHGPKIVLMGKIDDARSHGGARSREGGDRPHHPLADRAVTSQRKLCPLPKKPG